MVFIILFRNIYTPTVLSMRGEYILEDENHNEVKYLPQRYLALPTKNEKWLCIFIRFPTWGCSISRFLYLSYFIWQMVHDQRFFRTLLSFDDGYDQRRTQSSTRFILEWRRPSWKSWYSTLIEAETRKDRGSGRRTLYFRQGLRKIPDDCSGFGQEKVRMLILSCRWTRYCRGYSG